MIIPRVIPCLLLKNGGLVKTIKFNNETYIGDPLNAIRIFNKKEVDELALMDIEASKENKAPSFDIISSVAKECFMPFAYGGGIKSVEDIRKVLGLGAEKIIIGNYAIEHPEFIKEAANIFGSQSIIVSIDAKKNSKGEYEVFSKRGKMGTGILVLDFALLMVKMGAGELILTSIDKDGTMEGYDFGLISLVSKKVNIPVIATGGASNIDDFKKAIAEGASAVGASSMFVFYGRNRAVLISYSSLN